MYAFRLRAVAAALAAGVGLTACTTPYGYSGVSVGVGSSGYYDPYFGGYGYGYGGGYPSYGAGYGYGYGYPGYGYGYAPYWGWYDNFYYPGFGYYVYDIYRKPHRWSDAHRRYWHARREKAKGSKEHRHAIETQQQNWSGFDAGPPPAQQVQNDGRRERVERARPAPAGGATQVERVRPVRAERSAPRVERARPVRADRSAPQVDRARPVRAERQQAERPASGEVERRTAARVERAERQRVEPGPRPENVNRQASRELRRTEVRAERASRAEARERAKSQDE